MRRYLYLLLAFGLCLQWIVLRHFHAELSHPWEALLSGLCIFGASILLSWAGETAELDLPQSLSLGLIALVTVLPEYAVDIYFAWTAGKHPAYAAYATANMTGANRMLIGLAWPAVLLACWLKRGLKDIRLTKKNAVELLTLLAATLYSFVLPFKASLSLADSAALLALFVVYSYVCSRSGTEEIHLEGAAQLLARLPPRRRRFFVAGFFLFSAFAIYSSAAPFAEAILGLGHHLHIEEFLLVQWLAPLASEAPEFIVAVVFSLKGRAETGLRSLLSAKVNQWTLLVGMIPLAYNLSAGRVSPMPLDARQIEEILLTSAQSLLGLVMLLDFEFSFKDAGLLVALFLLQICFPQSQVRYGFAALYILLAAGLLLSHARRRDRLRELVAQAFH